MKKSGIFKYAAFFVFLAIFNLIFWLIADIDNMTTVNWIAYGVIHVSYLLIIFSRFLTIKHPDGQVGGFLLSNISMAFFPVQFILGVIFVIVPGDASWLLKLAIGLFGTVTLLYLFCVFSVMFISSKNKENKPRMQAERLAKVSVSGLKVIHARATDKDLKNKIEALIDRASVNPVTAEKAREFDMLSSKLESAVRASDKDKALSIVDGLQRLIG